MPSNDTDFFMRPIVADPWRDIDKRLADVEALRAKRGCLSIPDICHAAEMPNAVSGAMRAHIQQCERCMNTYRSVFVAHPNLPAPDWLPSTLIPIAKAVADTDSQEMCSQFIGQRGETCNQLTAGVNDNSCYASNMNREATVHDVVGRGRTQRASFNAHYHQQQKDGSSAISYLQDSSLGDEVDNKRVDGHRSVLSNRTLSSGVETERHVPGGMNNRTQRAKQTFRSVVLRMVITLARVELRLLRIFLVQDIRPTTVTEKSHPKVVSRIMLWAAKLESISEEKHTAAGENIQ